MTPTRQELVDRARAEWIRRLVDLSRRNNLLYFRSLKNGTLDLPTLAEQRFADLLSARSVPLGDLCALSEDPRLAGVAAEIRRRALSNREERGLETLYVALGSVTWQSDDGGRNPDAPAFLLPVAIQSPGRDLKRATLTRTGELEVNPVLLQALSQEHGIQIDQAALLTDEQKEEGLIDLPRVYDRLLQGARSLAGFQVSNRAVLGNFSFQKLAMVKDMRECAAQLAAHDVIAALAGDTDARAAMRPPGGDSDPHQLDQVPPDNEFLVRDADASQLQVIASTLGGEHVVIQGPPGTGKSQTISNLITSLVASGKRVLFVAEKRAALNVVRDRLEGAGLEHLTIDVHGADLTRKDIASQIKRTLSVLHGTRPVDASPVHSRFVDRRTRLNGHDRRMYSPREPSGFHAFAIQAQLLRIPQGSRSKTRWRGKDLDRITHTAANEIMDLLRQASPNAGLLLGTDASPWTGAIMDAGEKAEGGFDSAVRLHSTLLPALTTALGALCIETGLLLPATVPESRDRLDLLARVNSFLQSYDPGVFDQDLEAAARDLHQADKSTLHRAWAWLSNGRYRASRRTLNNLRKKGKAGSKLLLEEARAALVLQARWRAASPDGSSRPRTSDSRATEAALDAFAASLGSLGALLPSRGLPSIKFGDLDQLLDKLAQDSLTPFRLPRVIQIERRIGELGAEAILTEIRSTQHEPQKWVEVFRHAWLSSCLDRAWVEDPNLAAFVGRTHDGIVSEFRTLDRERLRLAADRVARAHAERAIAVMNQFPEQDAVVRGEAGKKARHLPIRKLMAKAPDVLTALCPCWMASPLSVSQLLGNDRRYFDVVIFDEASQVLPEDAIPSIMRASQVVVAGDRHQLPPSTFFADGGEDDDSESDEDRSQSAGFESLLDQISASSARSRPLTWHYRSRDEALIAYSNAHIYDWQLITFPSPARGDVLRHVLVPQAIECDGEELSSSAEVQRVVELVLEHARTRPNESLGVIALGIRHANRVDAAIDAALEQEPSLEPFFDPRAPERFFVKNLERVQGDERDAIILTLGLAKDRTGTLLNRLGPLNHQGGERRLNVAITRARSRMTTVSSFTHNDMDPRRFHAPGAELLRLYLQYADSGGQNLGRTPRRAAAAPNEFETDVAEALKAKGIPLLAQWGASDYWIDLVAQHPDDPGRFVLAIECDGATYHSAPTARDRDRLRQQHLESLGWRFHRIWSTDWFLRKDEEIERAVRAYERAVTDSKGPAPGGDSVEFGDGSYPNDPGTLRRAVDPTAPPSVRPSGKPRVSKGGDINSHSYMDLVRLVGWIKSDGLLRTDEQIEDQMMEELGFRRRGHRIVEAIRAAIQAEKRLRRDSGT